MRTEFGKVVRAAMGDKLFTVDELLLKLRRSELPGTTRRIVQKGGNPNISLGIYLAKCPDIERVGTAESSKGIWQVVSD